MMDHLTEDQRNEYIDNLLDEKTRQNAEAHLSQCVDCRNQVEALKRVFIDLENIPELPLPRDLIPAILAKLPQKKHARVWTRTFAVQWGVVTGTLVWLGTQLIPLARIPQVTLPKFPVFDTQALFVRLLAIQFLMPDFQLATIKYQLPQIHFQLQSLTPSIALKMSFQPSTTLIATFVISALLLWIVGNAILLHRGQEARE